jgi:hypothetical protein
MYCMLFTVTITSGGINSLVGTAISAGLLPPIVNAGKKNTNPYILHVLFIDIVLYRNAYGVCYGICTERTAI